MGDMTACLNDLSYIPPNNKQNEPTQGDIGETSNELTQAICNEFEELYVSANEELYPGCDYFFQNVFPTSKGYKIPPSYYAIQKTFKMIGLGYESIHACVNNCFLFRGEDNKDKQFCLMCNMSRWKDSNTPGKKVPKKVLHYFPIIPRLQHLYKSSHTAKEMTWHATGNCMEPGKMQHPVDGRAWKNFDTKYLDFAQEPRNVRLGLAADGFNPFGNLSQSNSMWPVILTTYNLPPWRSRDFNGEFEDGDPPRKFDQDEILVQLARLPTRVKGKHLRTRLEKAGHSKWLVARPKQKREQICSQTLMEDDMLKAQSKVDDILCNLKLIYSPGFFDIMIHLVIHLPLEALEGGHIRPRWMYPFERFIKKLKNYVRNKAKLEGSIVEGYVAEEALIFSSHYFQDVTTKFNRLDQNMDCPPPTPEIDTYRAKFKSEFPNKDMKEEFPGRFGSQIRQRHVDKDPCVSTSNELFALACRPTPTPISVNSCVVNGVRFVVHSRDERYTTQNSGICSASEDGEMYYGQLEEILQFSYMSFKIVLFRVKWVDISNKGRKVKHFVIRNNITQILVNEDDPDVIHFDNSSDLALSTSLNDLDFATLYIDGQLMDVDAPPDFIDVDEDDDIIDDEDALPYDLADYDDEDLVNVDDDDGVVVVYSTDVSRGHGGNGGGDDRPPSHQIGDGCRGKGTRIPNLGSRKVGRMHTRKETRNLGLRRITDQFGPQEIREFSMHYRSLHNIEEERKAGVMGKIGTQFDLKPYVQSNLWPKIKKGIEQHLAKIYTDNKSMLKADHWVKNPEDGTYDVEAIRSRRPANISAAD
ncbi:reverse transcriptase domain-containing protein [Tanacetum coccineum]